MRLLLLLGFDLPQPDSSALILPFVVYVCVWTSEAILTTEGEEWEVFFAPRIVE